MKIRPAVVASLLLSGANAALSQTSLVPQARKVTEVRATFGIAGK